MCSSNDWQWMTHYYKLCDICGSMVDRENNICEYCESMNNEEGNDGDSRLFSQ